MFPRSQQDPVSQGQAMSAFARAVRHGRATGAETRKWEDFVRVGLGTILLRLLFFLICLPIKQTLRLQLLETGPRRTYFESQSRVE